MPQKSHSENCQDHVRLLIASIHPGICHHLHDVCVCVCVLLTHRIKDKMGPGGQEPETSLRFLCWTNIWRRHYNKCDYQTFIQCGGFVKLWIRKLFHTITSGNSKQKEEVVFCLSCSSSSLKQDVKTTSVRQQETDRADGSNTLSLCS